MENTWQARLEPIYPPPSITHPGLQVICSIGCTQPHWTPAEEAFKVNGEKPFTYCCFRAVGDSRWASIQLDLARKAFREGRLALGMVAP